MPEGPEVRRFADVLDRELSGKPIVAITARTKAAKAWLQENSVVLTDKHIEKVSSHGKHLIGWIAGGYYLYSHLMMWGRWLVFPHQVEVDRRERARIVVPDAIAILYSAPIFTIGIGNPFELVENLRAPGPDILPYSGEPFDALSFRMRLLTPKNSERTIGAALLDQDIVAGIGNYLRAEILFECQIDPWRRVADLTKNDLERLCAAIPLLAQRAYLTGGATVSAEARTRLMNDCSLVYQPGSEYGTRHYVFRRTNLPCLRCNTTIRQLRQVTQTNEEGEKTRIIYFCPTCQNTQVEIKKPGRKRTLSPVTKEKNIE